MALWSPGPVFVFECVTAARRWSTYVGRVVFLAVLLVSLTVVWAIMVINGRSVGNLRQLAQVGESFFYALAGTQLTLVLLAAPAYTAGAICLDKARGSLAHLLVTNLSSAEIILGKLGARLLPVLSLVIAGLPLLALATLLGGIDPEAVLGSFLVTLGVGVAGCTLALALSVWSHKPHEVLLATYSVLAVLLLALPAWNMFSRIGPTPPTTPAWLEKSNPFWLAFAPYLRPQGVTLDDYLLFLGGCAGLTAVFTLLATLTLRRAAQGKVNLGTPMRKRKQARWHLPRFGPSLDFNPVLWREWNRRRPSRWARIVWTVYAVLSLGAFVLTLARTDPDVERTAAFVSAFQFSIGLLLVNITAVTSLFEERVRGSLDVLLTTPLPTSMIVWGKWWGAFRGVVLVMVLPTLMACLLAVQRLFFHPDVLLLLGLLVALMLAYGTAVTSLGLALATWVRRFSVALGLSVVTYVLFAGGTILVLIAGGPGGPLNEKLAGVSPWYGVGRTTWEIGHPNLSDSYCNFVWIMVYGLTAVVLAVATRVTFDRCLGRITKKGQPRVFYVRRREAQSRQHL